MTDVSTIQICIANSFTTLAHKLADSADECSDERNAAMLMKMAHAYQDAARDLNAEAKLWNAKAGEVFPS